MMYDAPVTDLDITAIFCVWLHRVQNDLGGTTPHLLESGCGNIICTQVGPASLAKCFCHYYSSYV